MRTFFRLGAFLSPLIAISQPTLNNVENFSVGTTLQFINCSTVNVVPGSLGANQTWNFSTLNVTTDTTTEWMVTPASTPNGSLFPSSNLVEKYSDGRYVYVNKSATENLLVGFSDPSINVNYPNPVKFMQRPVTYNDFYSDNFTTNYTASGYNFSGTGTITVNADAYGTLMLPGNTYSNTLRIKIQQTQVDTLIQFSSTYTTVSTTYVWFNNNHTSALLKIDTIGSPSFSQKSVTFLLSETVTGIKDNRRDENYSVYPNPAINEITVITKEVATLFLYDNLGKQVLKTILTAGTQKVPLMELPKGVYSLTLDERGIIRHQKLVIN